MIEKNQRYQFDIKLIFIFLERKFLSKVQSLTIIKIKSPIKYQ